MQLTPVSLAIENTQGSISPFCLGTVENSPSPPPAPEPTTDHNDGQIPITTDTARGHLHLLEKSPEL